jgi:hypothetical protein
MALTKSMTSSKRRFLFGMNVVIQALLVVAVVIGVVWIAGRFNTQSDWTSTGINSVSPRTEQLLKGLDENVRITAFFAKPDKERDKLQYKRWQELKDLLDLYQKAGGARVTTRFIEPNLEKAETDALLKRLQQLPTYRDEAKPHKEALEKVPAVAEKISTLASTELQRLQELLQSDPRLSQNRALNVIRSYWQRILQDSKEIGERINELKQAEVPRYGQAIKSVRDYLDSAKLRAEEASGWMSGDGLSLPGLTPEMKTFFEESAARYRAALADADSLLDATKDLKEVKLEEIHSELTRWQQGPPVLVESEKEARVVANYDIWQPPKTQQAPVGPGGDDRLFAGEAAISSAILKLTQKDKMAVVFTRFGGQSPIKPDYSQMSAMNMRQMPTAPYQQLAELLEKENFITQDWDVSKEKTPPKVEGTTRCIYVVFPPEPPPRQNPMEPSPQQGITPADRQIILDAVDASGAAVFLAGWAPPAAPFGGGPGGYEFADYLKSTWGVDVDSKHLAWRFTPNPQKPGWWAPATREPILSTGGGTESPVRLTEHPITEPLQNDRAAFFLTCPVRVEEAASRPAGLDVQVLAEVRQTKDVWALTDPMKVSEEMKRNQGSTRPGEGDVRAPFAIAVAASNAAGKKVVVFGSEQFMSDAVAEASGLMQVGNALVIDRLYPANSDLFVNTLHWLTGEAGRIAIGPRTADVPRLTKLDERWAERLPWLLVGAWPAVAVLVGVCVWFVRRR